MGMVSQLYEEEWGQFQRDQEKGSKKHTIIQLPCCGASIELQELRDQYVTCPDRFCGKRHHIAWGLRPKIQTEVINEQL